MRTLLIFASIFIWQASFAQTGVSFADLTLEEALVRAGKENKLVFLDGYTSWCGPCKWMSEEQFTKPEAGEFFNGRFINIKIDLEKGDGPLIAKRYGINAYPTFLVLRPDGDLQHKVVGADTLHRFIPMVEQGLSEKTSLRYVRSKMANGSLSNEEIPGAMETLLTAGDKDGAARLADSLFETLPDSERLAGRNWNIFRFLRYEHLSSPRFRYLVENSDRFQDTDRQDIYNIITRMLSDHLINHTSGRITKGDNVFLPELPEELPLIRELVDISHLGDKDFWYSWIDLSEAKFSGKEESYRELLERVLEFPQAHKGYEERHFQSFAERFIK